MLTSISIGTNEKKRDSWLKLAVLFASWYLLYWGNNKFWDWLLFRALPLDETSRLGESIRFFFYDSTKILLLLSGITFAVTLLRSFITIERTKAFLGGKRQGVGNLMAASAGIVTPFCSCSAVPVDRKSVV